MWRMFYEAKDTDAANYSLTQLVIIESIIIEIQGTASLQKHLVRNIINRY